MNTARDARFWDKSATKYAASPVADMDGFERTLAATREHLAGKTVLEFGCGTGSAALQLAPGTARYVATDISSDMIAIGKDKAATEGASNIEFMVATPDQAPFDAGTFDVAVGFNILHLIKDRRPTLKTLHRVLKPGGLLITKTPCLKEMGFLIQLVRLVVPVMQAIGRAPTVAFFNTAELEREISAAGFEIIERARHGSKPKPEKRIYLVARKI